MRLYHYIILAPCLLGLGCAEPAGFGDAQGDILPQSTPSPTSQAPGPSPYPAPLDGPLHPTLHTPQTWRVSQSGSGGGVTLPSALAQAEDGDIILLSPGRYPGPILITRPLTLKRDPEAPSGAIVLDGEQSPATLTIYNVRGAGVRLEGLTLTGAAPALGKGLEIVESDVIASDLTISGNGKGGRFLNSNTQIIRSEISHNRSSSGGAGLVVEGFGSTLLLNTLVARNQGTVGGGILHNGGLLTLRHTAVLGNMGTGEGGGIYVQSHPVIEATLLLQNSIIAYTSQGAGVYVHDDLTRVEAIGTIVWKNAAGDFDGVPIDFRRDLGNRAVDPGFVGIWPGGGLSPQDLYLKPSSPLINAAVGDGGDPDGSRADIGLYGGLYARFAYYDDRDDDGLYDGWESANGLKPWRRDALSDEDLDGLTNLEELHHGLNPRHSDTDGDGIDDLREINKGSDPDNPFSPAPQITLAPGAMPLDMAILRAPAGAEITLGEGRWEGRFSTLGKDITLRGLGRTRTTLSGGGLGPVLRFTEGEGPGTRIEDIAIRGGVGGRGGGIHIKDASPQLQRLTIEGNEADLGGGLYSAGGSPTLSDLRVIDNKGLGSGGGLFIGGGAITLERSTIQGNVASNGGGIAFSDHGFHSLSVVTIDGNRAEGEGGGISLLGETEVTGESIILSSNRADSGGGVYVADGALDLIHGTLVNNHGDFGGGLTIEGSPRVHLEATIIAYQQNGGGLVSDPRRGGSLELMGLLFWANNDGDLLGEALEPQALPPEARRGDPYFWSEPYMNTWAGDGLRLGPKSAGLDGAPWLGADPDGTPRDLGAFGGPLPDPSPHRDLDEDALPDGWERLWDRDPDELDTYDDLDGDGISNHAEFLAGLNPTRRDSDGDGLGDGDELIIGSDPRTPLPLILLPTDGFRSPFQMEDQLER